MFIQPENVQEGFQSGCPRLDEGGHKKEQCFLTSSAPEKTYGANNKPTKHTQRASTSQTKQRTKMSQRARKESKIKNLVVTKASSLPWGQQPLDCCHLPTPKHFACVEATVGKDSLSRSGLVWHNSPVQASGQKPVLFIKLTHCLWAKAESTPSCPPSKGFQLRRSWYMHLIDA